LIESASISSQTSPRWRALIGLLRTAWQEYERDHARYYAVAMVYYALVSLVPLLLLLLAVLGLMLRYWDLAGAAEQQVLLTIENRFGAYLRTSLERPLERLEQESIVATVISLAGLLMTASLLFRHLRLSFRAIWKYAPPLVSGSVSAVMRTTVLEYLIGFVMVMTGGALLLVALAAVAVTQWLGGLLIKLPLADAIPAWLLALPTSLLIVGLTFALLFRYLPPLRLSWRHVWLAALLCTVAWIIGAEMLVLSGAIFGVSPTPTGAMGGLLMVMFWMNLVSQVLFFGAEVCKVVATSAGEAR
jgi:membrane protein